VTSDWQPPDFWISTPPFPEFTDFERKVLAFIANEEFGADADKFLRQVEASRVTERFNTIHGFYTHVEVDRSTCEPVHFANQGAECQIEDFYPGVGVILFGTDGYLDMIEGFGYSEDDFENRDLADLKLLSAERRKRLT
jgi:hypothetical protein